MSVFVLKIIAMGTMLTDHMAFSFFDDPLWMRCIGRIAFPCYAFLLAEGFRHIKISDKRINAHLSKLVILAFVSEFCYDLMEYGFDFSEYASSQNCIITLLLAYLGLLATEKWKNHTLTVAIVYMLTAFLNYVCASNYRLTGVLLVYAFYWYLNIVMQPSGANYGYLKRFLMLLGIFVVYIPFYHMALFSFDFQSMITNFMAYLPWYVTHIAIAAILAMYNGNLGYKEPWFGTFYSWFYPVHLFIIGVILLIFVR